MQTISPLERCTLLLGYNFYLLLQYPLTVAIEVAYQTAATFCFELDKV